MSCHEIPDTSNFLEVAIAYNILAVVGFCRHHPSHANPSFTAKGEGTILASSLYIHRDAR